MSLHEMALLSSTFVAGRGPKKKPKPRRHLPRLVPPLPWWPEWPGARRLATPGNGGLGTMDCGIIVGIPWKLMFFLENMMVGCVLKWPPIHFNWAHILINHGSCQTRDGTLQLPHPGLVFWLCLVVLLNHVESIEMGTT